MFLVVITNNQKDDQIQSKYKKNDVSMYDALGSNKILRPNPQAGWAYKYLATLW